MKSFRFTEHFLAKEHKLPGVVTASEALKEANIGLQYQKEHIQAFGELAPVPTPLRVLKWNEEMEKQYAKQCIPLLSKEIEPLFHMLLEHHGIGCILYHFPCSPWRVQHFIQECEPKSGIFQKNGYTLYEQVLEQSSPISKTIAVWLKALSRMLLLGYFPNDPAQYATGQCIQPQNMAIRGAIADIDSLKPMREIPLNASDLFERHFWQMVMEAMNTISVYLLGPFYPTDLGPAGGGYDLRPSQKRVRAHISSLVFSQWATIFCEERTRLPPTDRRVDGCFQKFVQTAQHL